MQAVAVSRTSGGKDQLTVSWWWCFPHVCYCVLCPGGAALDGPWSGPVHSLFVTPLVVTVCYISRHITCKCNQGTTSLCCCSLGWSFQPLPWCLGASLVFLINVCFLSSVAFLTYNVCKIVVKFLNCIALMELIYMHFIKSVISRLLWHLEITHDVLDDI